MRATDKDDGRTVALAVGQHLEVTLSSTYWTFRSSSNAHVLRDDGPPKTVSEASRCVPGAGCGTVTATFIGASAGRAIVSATRTSCGEAMGCDAASGNYSLVVVVH